MNHLIYTNTYKSNGKIRTKKLHQKIPFNTKNVPKERSKENEKRNETQNKNNNWEKRLRKTASHEANAQQLFLLEIFFFRSGNSFFAAAAVVVLMKPID